MGIDGPAIILRHFFGHFDVLSNNFSVGLILPHASSFMISTSISTCRIPHLIITSVRETHFGHGHDSDFGMTLCKSCPGPKFAFTRSTYGNVY